MPPRRTDIAVEQRISTVHRVSIGLIAISLSLISLALGTALFVSPGAGFLFIPGPVSEQSAPSTATAVTLTWTAPGGDGNVGQATSYNLRYAASPITEASFDSATSVPGLPTPSPAGTTETATATNLQPATTYFFALKSTDDAGNVSAMSNVATKTTATALQACVPTYTCSEWTACVGGTQSRTCTATNGCPAGLDVPLTEQSCVGPVVSPDKPPLVGGGPVHVIKDIIVAGLAPGREPTVRVIDPVTKRTTKQFNAFAKSDRNGINVAAGDVTGDQQADVIVGTGAGTDPLVKVFTPDGRLVTSFNPYSTERKTGVAVAAGDVNADGIDEIITVPAKSFPQVRIWTYNQTTKKFTSLAQGFAYDRTQRQGYSVAAGDLDGDARAEIIVAPRLNGRSVTILNLNNKNELKVGRRFNPYPIQFTSGLTVAVGDVFGAGRANIITVGGPGYYSDVNIFDINGKLQTHFLPTSKAYRGGVTLTVLDVNRDGREEIITGTYRNGDPGLRVFRYSGLKKKFEQIQNYFIFPRTVKNGLRLGST